MKKVLYLGVLIIMLLLPNKVFAMNEVNVYFFHSSTCNICEQERIYLTALQKDRYPNMRIYDYETSDDANFALMNDAKELFGETRKGVPFTVVGDTVFYGFTQSMKGEIQRAVYLNSLNKYENKLGKKWNISYRTDLEGEVKEYKQNSNYTIEETSGNNVPASQNNENTDDDIYKSSIILITLGLILILAYTILMLLERRKK